MSGSNQAGPAKAPSHKLEENNNYMFILNSNACAMKLKLKPAISYIHLQPACQLS